MAIEDILHPLLGRYMGSPRWVRASAGRAWAMLPQRMRLGRGFDTFRAQIESTEGNSDAGRVALAKLDKTLRWAIETVPAYQSFRNLLQGHRDPREMLARLPVADKLDLKRQPHRYLSQAMP